MSRKFVFILLSVFLLICISVGSMFILSRVEKQLTERLITQNSAQGGVVADQTSRALQKEVENVTTELQLIASNPIIRDGTSEECQAELDALTQRYDLRLGNIGRVNRDGVFQCSINRNLIGSTANNLGSYITEIFDDPEHKPVMSRAIKPAGADSYLVAVHVPVYDANGEFDGTLGGAIYFDDIRENFLQGINFAQQGFVSLYDDDGTIMYRPQADLIGKNIHSPEFLTLTPDIDIFDRIFANALAGNPGSDRYIINGTDRLVAYHPVDVMPDRKWIVIVSVPYGTILQNVQETGIVQLLTRSSVVLVALTSATFIILLLYVLRGIFGPIGSITKVTQKIAAGNLDVKVNIKGRDDIGKLAAAFNSMTDQLKESYSSLEGKVQERTKELSQKIAEIEKINNALTSANDVIALEKAQADAMLSGIGDGVFAINAQRQIILFNPVAAQMSGFSAQEAVGRPYTDILKFVSKKDGTVVDDFIQQAFSGRKANMSLDTDLVNRKGIHIPVADSAAPIFNAYSEVVAVIVIFRDVTTEASQASLIDKILTASAERIRQPFTKIQEQLTSLLTAGEEFLSPTVRDSLKIMQTASSEVNDVLSDISSSANLSTGKVQYIIEPMDVYDMAYQAVEKFRSSAEEKGLKFILYPEVPELFLAQGDKHAVHQVFTQLLTNSIKFTGVGSVFVHLTQTDQHVKVQIIDTGEGISPEDQTKLFHKFSSFTGATKNGTGLGLTIAQTMIRELGGDLWLENSAMGRGSTFSFTLPKPNTAVALKVLDKMQKRQATS